MASRLYGIVWRWHFLVGLIALPIVVVIALSGALYAFEPELAPFIEDRIELAQTTSASMTIDEAVHLAEGPRCTPTGMYVPSRRDRAWQVYCREGEDFLHFIDPYRRVVIGEKGGHTWMDIVFHIHWELMLGAWGRRAIEWGTSCVVVLLLTGVYLWWPRGKRKGGGVWWPRRELRARQWLRDLHAVIGVYLLPIMLVVTATGLMWTIHAGAGRWDRIAGDRVGEIAKSPPTSTPTGGPRISLAAGLAAAGYDRATDPRALYFSLPSKDVKEALSFYIYDDAHQTPWTTQSVYIDAYTGRVLEKLEFDDRGMLGKVDTLRYSLHVGSILGLAGRIAVFIATLAVVALCITGPWMWWKRRAKGTLGVPPRARRIAWPLWALLLVLGAILPMFGLTLLVIIAIEAAKLAARLWSTRNVGTHP